MIHIIDLHFQGNERTIASFLVETDEGPIIVETGPHSTLPYLEKGIKERGYSLSDIKHVFLTHIHLDHAGAVWVFAEYGAKIYVHPRGLKHLQDPSRLLQSAKQIYEDKMEQLWGTLKPIPGEKLIAIEHEQSIEVGSIVMKAFHTPGHAVHHIAWKLGDQLFTGDVAGVQINQGPVVPPCPPPDINLKEWRNSLDLIRKLEVNSLYLTHFGKVDKIEQTLTELYDELHHWANWIKPHWEKGKTPAETVAEFEAHIKNRLEEKGVDADLLAKYEYANPSWMSVAGLMRYWKKAGENAEKYV